MAHRRRYFIRTRYAVNECVPKKKLISEQKTKKETADGSRPDVDSFVDFDEKKRTTTKKKNEQATNGDR